MKDKREMVRLVLVADRVQADLSARKPGRGAYLCRQDACWHEAVKRRGLERALRVKLSPEDWRQLRVGILT